MKGFLQRRFLHVAGKATVDGTKTWIDSLMANSKLKLYHKFNVSGLTINPLIHGPPKFFGKSSDTYDRFLAQSLVSNGVNCAVVYNKDTAGNTWYTDKIGPILQQTVLERENLVLIANIGAPQSGEKTVASVKEAVKKCKLEYVDYVIISCENDTLEDSMISFTETVDALEQMSKAGIIHGYGVDINVTPYCYHTPPLKKGGKGLLLPTMYEDLLTAQTKFAEIVMYPISPTTAMPATYPTLEDRSVWREDDVKEIDRMKRLTRIAANPLICYPGSLNPIDPKITQEKLLKHSPEEFEARLKNDDEMVRRLRDAHEGIAEDPTNPTPPEKIATSDKEDGSLVLLSRMLPPALCKTLSLSLDQLCPELATTPKIEEKAMRAVLSVGIDSLMVDADSAQLLGPFTLRPQDLLPDRDTEDIFGTFSISIMRDFDSVDEEIQRGEQQISKPKHAQPTRKPIVNPRGRRQYR